MYTIRDYMINMILNDLIRKQLIRTGLYFGEKKDAIDKKIIEDKREYRKALKGALHDKYLYQGEDGEGYGEIVNGGGDYDHYWQKIFFPDECWTEEEKREFVDDNWVRATPSQYDCTGQIFTWAIDVFNVPSGVVAYIRYAMDV